MDRKELYKKVIQESSKLLGADQNETFIRNVVSFIKKIKVTDIMSNYPSLDDGCKKIAEMYKDSLNQIYVKQHDHNEFLNKNMNDTPTHSFAPLTNWLADQSPTLTSKTTTIYLDSRYRNNSYDSGLSIQSFQYSLVPKNMSKGNGNVPSRIIPYNITYFQITKILLPYAGALASRNLTKEINLAFTNLLANSIDTSSRDFHFSFTYRPYETNWVELVPINSMYKFYPPLKNVDNLNLQFYDPYEPVQFYPDYMRASQVNYVTSDGRITFPSNHNLSTGDIVIIEEFTTNDDASNVSILNSICDKRGLLITVINSTVIAINIDLSAIVSPNSNSKPLVRFLKYTFRIAIEIGYQDEK
jgi:hypothetical protein